MELWIRSQDRRQLLKVNDGLYIANGFDDTPDTFIGIKNVGHVGRYTTEKRALEVLDEIQNIIINDGVENEEYDKASGCYYAVKKNVYEMPQE